MLGAIAGDIIGSIYEFNAQMKSESFPLFSARSQFTDDTVLTVAVADAILQGGDYGVYIKDYARRYPDASYGGFFRRWMAQEESRPYNSYGNGSAMRVSPVAWAFDTRDAVLAQAERCSAVTHNHPEGIKGAQAVALAVYLARNGQTKDAIRNEVSRLTGYNLGQRLDEIRPTYHYDVTCQGSVPQSIIAFLEADGVEDAIRKAVSLGGDADTMAAIAGSIAEAFYQGVPQPIKDQVERRLPKDFSQVIDAFYARFVVGSF